MHINLSRLYFFTVVIISEYNVSSQLVNSVFNFVIMLWMVELLSNTADNEY